MKITLPKEITSEFVLEDEDFTPEFPFRKSNLSYDEEFKNLVIEELGKLDIKPQTIVIGTRPNGAPYASVYLFEKKL